MMSIVRIVSSLCYDRTIQLFSSMLDFPTLETIRDNFMHELQDAKEGKITSLPFIKHPLTTTPLVANGEVFQTLVIGGTVCRSALVKKENGHFSIFSLQEKLQPLFRTKEDFFAFIDKELDTSVSVIVLNFAYALEPVFEKGKLDGTLLGPSKEHTFTGMIGEQVGKLVEEHIKEAYKKTVRVAVANDIICLLLSGLTHCSWDTLACGIVGTGLNLAVFTDEQTAVNLEAANFDKFPLSETAKAIDEQSSVPGKALFEKEISGAYLYQHFNLILQQQGIHHPPVASTLELASLALEADEPVKTIACTLIERSAALLACAVAGVTLWYGRQTFLDKQKVCFVMDGSFFWENKMFHTFVLSYVDLLVPEQNVDFVKMENPTILGAAELVS